MPSSLTEEKLSAIYEKFWGRQTEYGLEIKSQDAAISKDELDKRIEAEFENHRLEAYEAVLGVKVADKMDP